MSNFRQFDRATGSLLPPSLDEWLAERQLARFVRGPMSAPGGSIDEAVKEVRHHFAGALLENEAEPLDEAARQERFQERRPKTRPKRTPFQRTTQLRTKAAAIARQAGQHTPTPPRRIWPATAAPRRPLHMGRDRHESSGDECRVHGSCTLHIDVIFRSFQTGSIL
jgi:hypothetical protein